MQAHIARFGGFALNVLVNGKSKSEIEQSLVGVALSAEKIVELKNKCYTKMQATASFETVACFIIQVVLLAGVPRTANHL